jgi:hypothetical protein
MVHRDRFVTARNVDEHIAVFEITLHFEERRKEISPSFFTVTVNEMD